MVAVCTNAAAYPQFSKTCIKASSRRDRDSLSWQQEQSLLSRAQKLQELRQPFLTLVVFFFNRKEVKIFKRSKKQEQEKGMWLQRQPPMLEVSVVFRLRFFSDGNLFLDKSFMLCSYFCSRMKM